MAQADQIATSGSSIILAIRRWRILIVIILIVIIAFEGICSWGLRQSLTIMPDDYLLKVVSSALAMPVLAVCFMAALAFVIGGTVLLARRSQDARFMFGFGAIMIAASIIHFVGSFPSLAAPFVYQGNISANGRTYQLVSYQGFDSFIYLYACDNSGLTCKRIRESESYSYCKDYWLEADSDGNVVVRNTDSDCLLRAPEDQPLSAP